MTKTKVAMGIITCFFAVATRVSKASPSSAPSFCQREDCVLVTSRSASLGAETGSAAVPVFRSASDPREQGPIPAAIADMPVNGASLLDGPQGPH